MSRSITVPSLIDRLFGRTQQTGMGKGGTFAGGGATGRWEAPRPRPTSTPAVPATLPQAARAEASNNIQQQLESQAAPATTSQPVKVSAITNPDWRCRLTWPYAETDFGQGVFQYLPGFNTIIWPYTPEFVINYQANYDMVKTLQTNFGTPVYQSSEMSTIQITGPFTASTVYEANYVYAVIHFLKSATKGHNIELNANQSAKPPPVLRLTYLGEGGLRNVPVVLQTFNITYPQDVDYVRTDMSNGSMNVGPSMVPAEINISITLVPTYSRAEMISTEYSTTRFINGELISRGYF
jgi:hypothetical protein